MRYERREMVATKRMFFDFYVYGLSLILCFSFSRIGKMRIPKVSLHCFSPSMRFRRTAISRCSRSRFSRR